MASGGGAAPLGGLESCIPGALLCGTVSQGRSCVAVAGERQVGLLWPRLRRSARVLLPPSPPPAPLLAWDPTHSSLVVAAGMNVFVLRVGERAVRAVARARIDFVARSLVCLPAARAGAAGDESDDKAEFQLLVAGCNGVLVFPSSELRACAVALANPLRLPGAPDSAAPPKGFRLLPSFPITTMAVCPTSALLAVASGDGQLGVWATDSLSPSATAALWHTTVPGSSRICCVAVHPRTQALAVALWDGKLVVYTQPSSTSAAWAPAAALSLPALRPGPSHAPKPDQRAADLLVPAVCLRWLSPCEAPLLLAAGGPLVAAAVLLHVRPAAVRVEAWVHHAPSAARRPPRGGASIADKLDALLDKPTPEGERPGGCTAATFGLCVREVQDAHVRVVCHCAEGHLHEHTLSLPS